MCLNLRRTTRPLRRETRDRGPTPEAGGVSFSQQFIAFLSNLTSRWRAGSNSVCTRGRADGSRRISSLGNSLNKPQLLQNLQFLGPIDSVVSWVIRFMVCSSRIILVCQFPIPQFSIAPFSFGRRTESGESWIRSAPFEQEPGRFTTLRGWLDPFRLLQSEDPDGKFIASVIAQEGVRPEYSGALIVGATGELIVEGKRGTGESLMIGTAPAEKLPIEVKESVTRAYQRANAVLGPVRFEWVYDKVRCWIVQLHCGATNTDAYRLVPGNADRWGQFDVAEGLSALRRRLATLDPGSGLILRGRIGLTSHMAELIRNARVPARIEP